MFYFAIGGLFIILGFVVHVLKWHFLISGYNTMSKEKKANVDTKGLGRLIGFYSYVSGGVFIAYGVLNVLGLNSGMIPIFVYLGISTVLLLVKAQKYTDYMEKSIRGIR